MTLGMALKEMLHRSGMTQSEVTTKAGYKTPSAIGTPIAKNEMNVSTLVKLAHVAGYKVVLVRENPDPMNPEYPIYIGCAGSVDVEGVKKEVE